MTNGLVSGIKKMKLIKFFLLVVLFSPIGEGWILGAQYGSTGIAIDQDFKCAKYEGEVRECSMDDLNMMISLSKLYVQD